jgi:hypothetical protein
MDAAPSEIDPIYRDVTPEELEHYRKFGWVKLDKFVPASEVRKILAMAKELKGEDGLKDPPPKGFSYFNPYMLQGLNSPLLRPIVLQAGRAGRVLLSRRAPVGIQYFTDFLAIKLPSENSVDHGGNGSSDWHQDYAASACDRTGGMVFWMALTDMKPELGTMKFLSGSHNYGVMGHYTTHGEGNLLDSYPELLDDCTDSGQLSYCAGDVTVHSNLCVHGAGANLTADPRWTYIIIVSPADACWTGGPADAFDTAGLTLHKPLDRERFPIIG